MPFMEEADMQFAPVKLKYHFGYPYRILHRIVGDVKRKRILPVNYLKFNNQNNELTSLWANFAVRGTVED